MKCKIFLLSILFVISATVEGQIITTYAGNGIATPPLENVPATSSSATLPGAGSFDALGNFYFASSPFRIRKVSALGIVTTVVGTSIGYGGDGGPATAAMINCSGMFVDSTGNIYIADFTNKRIRKVDAATGIINTIAGNGMSGSSGDGGPATAATISCADVITDNAGNVYATDNTAGTLRKIDAATGIISTFSSVNGFLCFDALYNYLYFGSTRVCRKNMSTGVLDTIAGTGLAAYNGDGIAATAANFRAFDIALDANNNLYIADDGNDRIRMVDAAGIIHTIAGTTSPGYNGDGIPATTAQIYNPEGLAFDRCGNLYIADDANNRVRKILFAMPGADPVATISSGTGDTVCVGSPATFTLSLSGTGTADTIRWYVNGVVASGTGNTYTYIPANGDSISSTVKGGRQCDGGYTAVSNTLHLVTSAPYIPTLSITGTTAASLGSTVTVTATVAGAGGSYALRWMNRGVQFATTTVPSVTYTKGAGTDTITARVVATGTGCYDSALSGTHRVTVARVGIAQAGMAQLRVYPNPASSQLHIDNPGTEAAYRILDMVGTVRQYGSLGAGSNILDMQALPQGIYLVEVSGEDGRQVGRVVKL